MRNRYYLKKIEKLGLLLQGSIVIIHFENGLRSFSLMNRSSIVLDLMMYVRRRPGEEFTQRCTKPTVKRGGDSVMVWGAMMRSGTGPIHCIEGIMDQHVYVDFSAFFSHLRRN